MSDYFDIDDFLLGEENVPITIDRFSRGVGFLAGGSSSDDIEEGTKVNLPFWLAHVLHVDSFSKIENLPKFLGDSVLRQIEATSFSLTEDRYKEINLNSLTNYYFDLCVTYYHSIGSSENTEEELKEKITELMDVVRKAFGKRYKTLVESAFFRTTDNSESEKIQWTTVEKSLFDKGSEASEEFDYFDRHLKEKDDTFLKKRRRGIDFGKQDFKKRRF